MKQITRYNFRFSLRLFAMILVATLLFVTLIFSSQAIEVDSYFNPLWDWNPGTPQNPRYHHMRFFPTSFSGISATGMRLLRAGMAFPDGVRIDANGNVIRTGQTNTVHPTINCACRATHNINLRGRRFRTFHGYHTHSSTNDLNVNNMFHPIIIYLHLL